MRRQTFKVLQDGEWVEPVRRGYLLKCCRCSLVHVVNFRLVKRNGGKAVQFQLFRRKRQRALGGPRWR